MDVNIESENKIVESINTLFKTAGNIRIPAYQRAFSWESKQCSQFLDDLIEQKGKRYYLGQFLFEKEGDTLFIIDGQQRLTTTILFLSAIAKIKATKGKDIQTIRETYLTEVFKTIEDDQVIFKKITQKHLISIIDCSFISMVKSKLSIATPILFNLFKIKNLRFISALFVYIKRFSSIYSLIISVITFSPI